MFSKATTFIELFESHRSLTFILETQTKHLIFRQHDHETTYSKDLACVHDKFVFSCSNNFNWVALLYLVNFFVYTHF